MRPRSRKARYINWGCVGPALLYSAAAIAILVGAITLVHRAHHGAPPPTSTLQRTSGGTLARELARCQALGRKAEDDSRRLAAWAENRRRFFGIATSPEKASHP